MQLKHFEYDGRARFFTFVTTRRIPVFANDKYCRMLACVIDKQRQLHTFRLLGYVFMPDHVHLVLIPHVASKTTQIVGFIKRYSSRLIHEDMVSANDMIEKDFLSTKGSGVEFALWQRGCYDHNCRTIDSVRKMLAYCHNNPVVNGLVTDPREWEWSSYGAYIGIEDIPLAVDRFEVW